jgi:PAS domain S-box-containing protein
MSSESLPYSEHLDSLIERIGVEPLGNLIGQLLKTCATTLGVERVSYWTMLNDGRAIRREHQYYLSKDEVDNNSMILTDEMLPVYFSSLHKGRSLIVSPDAKNDPRLLEFREGEFGYLEIGAMLDAPVHRQGRLTGIICHEHIGGPRDWSARDIDFARHVAQWISLAMEIDERQQTREALRESEERYHLVMEHSPTPTVVLDTETGLFADANASALAFFGVDRATLLKHSPADFSPELQPDGLPSRESTRGHVERVLAGEHPSFEWVHQNIHGDEIPAYVHLSTLPGSGKPKIIAAITDRTEQVRTERTIRRALENERELNELRTRFTSIVSHEFRTPLGIIMSAIELLRNYFDRLDLERRKELFDDIHSATRRMGVLMEQVLVLGRADVGKLTFTPAPIDLPTVCEKLVDESQSATVMRCVVDIYFDGDLSGAMSDEPLLRHIFTNLLSNAAKYSPEGSKVEFRVGRDSSDAVFTVIDHGIGIPEEDQPRVFEAFQRAGNVGEISGSGLGLLIAKRCVEMHGGEIGFVSEPGEGTAFTVRLPVFQ